MASTACLNCGGEISPGDRVCRHCGATRRRMDTPSLWAPQGRRRTAALAGAILALLIVGVLAWVIATWPRHAFFTHRPVVPSGGAVDAGG